MIEQEKKVNGFGIASFVLGILGILLVCCGGFGGILGGIGLILGILGLIVLKNSPKGLAVAGTILSGLALGVGLFIFGFSVYGDVKSTLKADESNQVIDELETKETDIIVEKENKPIETKPEPIFKESIEPEEEPELEINETIEESGNENDGVERDKNGVSIELKEFLDSYEDFMDQYVEFMQNYNVSDMSALTEYSELMIKYYDFLEKTEKYDGSDEMTIADEKYYTECMLRIEQKLINASIDMQY